MSSGRIPNDEELVRVLNTASRAVLALSSGGCARYAMSTEVPFYCANGALTINYTSQNPHKHRMLISSTLSLRLPLPPQSISEMERILVLEGTFDAEKRERSACYDAIITYRFSPECAHIEEASGARVRLNLEPLLEKIFTN